MMLRRRIMAGGGDAYKSVRVLLLAANEGTDIWNNWVNRYNYCMVRSSSDLTPVAQFRQDGYGINLYTVDPDSGEENKVGVSNKVFSDGGYLTFVPLTKYNGATKLFRHNMWLIFDVWKGIPNPMVTEVTWTAADNKYPSSYVLISNGENMANIGFSQTYQWVEDNPIKLGEISFSLNGELQPERIEIMV